MLKRFFSRLFGRKDPMRIYQDPHHTVNRCPRLWDTVTRPGLMPSVKSTLRSSVSFR